jgi:hypothetical protein
MSTIKKFLRPGIAVVKKKDLNLSTTSIITPESEKDIDIPALVRSDYEKADNPDKPVEINASNNQNIYSTNPLEIESMLKSAVDEDVDLTNNTNILVDDQVYETINEFNNYIDEANNEVYATPTNKTLTNEDKLNFKNSL